MCISYTILNGKKREYCLSWELFTSSNNWMSFMFTHHKNSITFFVSKLFWSCFLFGWRHLVKLYFFLRKHYILENLFSIQRYCFKKMFVYTIFFFIYVFFPVWHIMIPRLMEKIMFLEHLLFSEFSFEENLSNNERIPSPFFANAHFLHFDAMLTYFSKRKKKLKLYSNSIPS